VKPIYFQHFLINAATKNTFDERLSQIERTILIVNGYECFRAEDECQQAPYLHNHNTIGKV
jgi:transcription termination factor NusB